MTSQSTHPWKRNRAQVNRIPYSDRERSNQCVTRKSQEQREKPAQRQIVVELLHQLQLRAHRVDGLQELGAKQSLRLYRSSVVLGIEPFEFHRQSPKLDSPTPGPAPRGHGGHGRCVSRLRCALRATDLAARPMISRRSLPSDPVHDAVGAGLGERSCIAKEHASTARNLLGSVASRKSRRHAMNDTMSLAQRADALEAKMARELDYIVIKSRLYSMAEGDMRPAPNAGALMKDNPNARVLMGDDPRLPAMPEQPTLMDFFKYRFGPCMHLLQSARHAVKADLPEKMVLACLLHDISTIGFIRGDHGYWGAQLVEPYVDEEVTWAIRAHQVLRFYPDESVGYEYPQSYITAFGQEYRPDPYIEEDYKRMRNHKWYMSGRQITVHDIYSFDPNVHVELEEFTDIIGRNFRQPEQGLGFDNSPVAHMWRAMIRPAKYL